MWLLVKVQFGLLGSDFWDMRMDYMVRDEVSRINVWKMHFRIFFSLSDYVLLLLVKLWRLAHIGIAVLYK